MERNEKWNISKNLLKGTLVAGALFSVSSLTAATTSSLFDYETMGSGSQVRSELLSSPSATSTANYQITAGENKTMDASCGENKTKDASCGANKKEMKKESKDSKAQKESKVKDANCGDKKAKADSTKTESKTKEGKCGEGTCGK